MNRLVGLHLRYQQSPFEVLEKAKRHDLVIAQLFLHSEKGLKIHFSREQFAHFRNDAAQQFKQLVAHGSYLINLASSERTYHPALNNELYCAQQLGCTHFLLHPGSAHAQAAGIDSLARELNKLARQPLDVQIVLENTAFAAPSLGGDLNHFKMVLEKLDQPEKVFFCIDTAHAYVAGYDLNHNQQAFIDLIKSTIGAERIALIHANDTTAAGGSNIDLHCMIGKGNISQGLQTLVRQRELSSIPLILELPLLNENEEETALAIVRSWDKKETIN